MRELRLLDNEKEENEIENSKEKRLHESAMKGSVTSLLNLLQEDPQILCEPAQSFSDSPLHISALLGHSDFVNELLSRKPELAGESNSRSSSALHLAAAKGYPEMVRNLALVNSDVCLVKDRDGLTPLHLAAIKGRVGALTELVRVRPDSTYVLTGRGESGLHLCVKYNRLEALKVFVESIGRENEFVNWRDYDGNTVLHVAVAKKQLEIIKYLLTNTKTEVNAQNGNGFTALDILSRGPRDVRDMEIKHCLQKAGASRSNKSQSGPHEHYNHKVSPTKQPLLLNEAGPQQTLNSQTQTDWFGRQRSALMVVASLLATVTFQAAISPPGGVWEQNPVESPRKVGASVMAYTSPERYGQLMIFNTIALLGSLSIILLLISGLPMKQRRWMWTQMVIMWLAITAHTWTYILALTQITPKHVEGVLFRVTRVSVWVWQSMIGVVFVGNLIRMVLWLMSKYRCVEKKQSGTREDLSNVEDDE